MKIRIDNKKNYYDAGSARRLLNVAFPIRLLGRTKDRVYIFSYFESEILPGRNKTEIVGIIRCEFLEIF